MFSAVSYVQANFFDFFEIFFYRFFSLAWFSGGMASDELQILALFLMGVTASFLGSLLYLHRSTMIANTISHTSLLGIVVGILAPRFFGYEIFFDQGIAINTILLGAFVSAGLTSILTYLFRFRFFIRTDASVAMAFSILSAAGIAAVSLLFGRAHVGLDLVMGDLELVTLNDVRVLLISTLVNVVLCVLLQRGYFALIFDGDVACCWFPYIGWLQFLLLFQVAISMTASLRSMGLFLPLAYLVGIPIWARCYSNNVIDMWKLGTLLSFGLSICSVALARGCLTVLFLDLSSAGISILCLLGMHFVSLGN